MEGTVSPSDNPLAFGIARGAELVQGFGLAEVEPEGLQPLAELLGSSMQGVEAHPVAAVLIAECTVVAEAARRRIGEESVDEGLLKEFEAAFARFALCIFHP
ncbi:MAG: hypothetical protein QOI45_2084 [Thermoleophilaceae bacterium]|nr:hypothetical protein [Thermoleophilaceae bacterium]